MEDGLHENSDIDECGIDPLNRWRVTVDPCTAVDEGRPTLNVHESPPAPREEQSVGVLPLSLPPGAEVRRCHREMASVTF